jgi:hypothetical protein
MKVHNKVKVPFSYLHINLHSVKFYVHFFQISLNPQKADIWDSIETRPSERLPPLHLAGGCEQDQPEPSPAETRRE